MRPARFSMARLKEGIERYPAVRAIEIKLSQGAKPGVGGFLPRKKVTPEIAAARGIPLNRDCASPGAHRAFHDADSLLDFAEAIADETGLPVGIKSAVGELAFWKDLARHMSTSRRGVDFITIDGGEGGTGAGPLVFTDHVALPFKMAFGRVHRIFDAAGISENVVFAGSGKLGFPQNALLAFAMGCDMINVGREAMIAIGCIPGPAVSHQPLSHRRGDTEPVAGWRAGPAVEGGPGGQLHRRVAQRFASLGVRVRCPPPESGSSRSARASGRPVRFADGRRSVRTSCNMAVDGRPVDAQP